MPVIVGMKRYGAMSRSRQRIFRPPLSEFSGSAPVHLGTLGVSMIGRVGGKRLKIEGIELLPRQNCRIMVHVRTKY